MHLNVEQMRLVKAEPSGHILIKGVAGSGKTTVAVNRIPFLLDHYCYEDDDKILMVTYNRTLTKYVKYLYKKSTEGNSSETMSLFSKSNGRHDKVSIRTVDSLLKRYYHIYKEDNNLNLTLVPRTYSKLNLISRCISKVKKDYPKVKILNVRNNRFLFDEIRWIKACNYLELSEYQNVDRLGRMSYEDSNNPQRLLKNSDVREAIFQLMNTYDKELRKEGYIDFGDIALLGLEQAKKEVIQKYTHILIDEGQDLTRVQYEFLKLLYNDKPYSSIYFIADTAQSIYPHSYLVKGRSFKSLGFDMTGKSRILSKNYRTTTQIAQAAYSLIENDHNIIDNENFVRPSLLDRQGHYPIYRYYNDTESEIKNTIKEINKLSSKYAHKDIAIITKTNSYLYDIQESLNRENIDSVLVTKNQPNFDKESIKLLTIHSIKGLEFKVVFILGINKGTLPFGTYADEDDKSIEVSNERKLLYVGMTRASELLYMSSSSSVSLFIKEINPKYLRLDYNCKLRRFYRVPFDRYLFKNDIDDKYRKEEYIRQWLLSELIEVYNYPQDLINVEYQINNYSKAGYADVVINIYPRKTRTPYIVAEVKPYMSDLSSALAQLKSYMSNCQSIKYGLTTNGNKVITIDKNFNEIPDIPSFAHSMLPSSLEEYEFAWTNQDKKYTILVDRQDSKEITIRTNGSELNYGAKKTVGVPIYGEVAAGQPIYMNLEIDKFYLPNNWISNKKVFLLKVRGDSMIDANIQEDDLVLVVKQTSADIRDIVVAALGDKAVLKRYNKIGNNVLLLSENKDYEPILIENEQANILGKVIGLLKNKE